MRRSERLRADILTALARHPEIESSDIEIELHNGTVKILGSVENFQHKREVESAITRIHGVNKVMNLLTVVNEQTRPLIDIENPINATENPFEKPANSYKPEISRDS